MSLHDILARIGLSKYEARLRENGFDDWNTVTAIIEGDMEEMNFTLGDRRKLQNAINSFDTTRSSSLPSKSDSDPPRPERQKRKYKRRPHQDPNAPTRPKSAYVLFGEHVRSNGAMKALSFAEAAKATGKLWHALPEEERLKLWEKPAAEKLARYKLDMQNYEQTQEYKDHQAYLVKFRGEQQARNKAGRAGSAAPTQDESDHDQSATWYGEEEGDIFPPQPPSFELDVESLQDTKVTPFEAGLAEVRNVHQLLGVASRFSPVRPYPPEEFTASAMEKFAHNTGSLLFLWSKDEIEGLLNDVYHAKGEINQADVAEVFAMAAIGSYCDGDLAVNTYQLSFMDTFMYSFNSRRDIDELRGMRLFACLAICRFTNGVHSARRLIREYLTQPVCMSLMTVSRFRFDDWERCFEHAAFGSCIPA